MKNRRELLKAATALGIGAVTTSIGFSSSNAATSNYRFYDTRLRSSPHGWLNDYNTVLNLARQWKSRHPSHRIEIHKMSTIGYQVINNNYS